MGQQAPVELEVEYEDGSRAWLGEEAALALERAGKARLTGQSRPISAESKVIVPAYTRRGR